MGEFALLFGITFAVISLFAWLLIYTRGRKSRDSGQGSRQNGCSSGGCCCSAQSATHRPVHLQQKISHL